MKVIDREGNTASAFRLQGPTILNTVFGEVCGNEGDYTITLNDGRLVVFPEDHFNANFMILGEE